MSVRKMGIYRIRRIIAAIITVLGVAGFTILNPASYEQTSDIPVRAEDTQTEDDDTKGIASDEDNSLPLATEVLAMLEVKGRAPKTGYSREEFYSTWPEVEGCSLRQIIIRREFGESAKLADDRCTVLSGEYTEPYTGKVLSFSEKKEISNGVQIDHVVALSNAWQTGAQYKTSNERYQMATDPLNLLAVDASANQQKSDGDAATWLPSNKSFRCQYVARQIAVKYKYQLWVTAAEQEAMAKILETCPGERVIAF